MKSDSILTALLDEVESLSKADRPRRAGLFGAVAAVLAAAVAAVAAYVLLGATRRRRIGRRIASVSRASVRKVRNGLADLRIFQRRSSNGSRRPRTARAGAR